MSKTAREKLNLMTLPEDIRNERTLIEGTLKYWESLAEIQEKRIAGLVAEVERLRLYERAIASMAAQFIHPKTTPEEFARMVLKGDEPRSEA